MVQMSKAKMEKGALPRRFYAQAGYEAVDGRYGITLDGKAVRTPQRHLLQVKAEPLAAAIAAEWEAQKEVIDPHAMPLTRLAHIAIDRVAGDRAELLADIARYAETDLLCYRAPVADVAHPLANDAVVLRERQDRLFDPVLRWVDETFAAPFAVTEGLLPVAQRPTSLEAIAAVYAAADDAELAALAMMVPLLGSALLTLAVWKGFVEVEAALIAARLDEGLQAERWGEDAETAKAFAVKANDIRASAFFLTHN